MATVEVRSSVNLRALLEAETSVPLRIDCTADAPAGLRWFNISVETRQHGSACAAVSALVRVINRAVDSGSIENYRIVRGKQWLRAGEQSNAIERERCY